ncbi:helix-turn-helix transcriptional regulator [Burkholderia sp. Leaf177]|uniref:helix-turn-helix transcriptional regulator n=1 Tax=Burkholderia sp. Leaf177 TaxID=1736287 RepID=UPI0009EA29DF|nr:AraC family transcriptional regulator [Burkholderia sp. Leaf177]
MPSRTSSHFSDHNRTVSNRIAVFAMDAAERAGMSPQLFTTRTGISAQELVDKNGRIDAARHRRVVELMAHVGASSRVMPDRPHMLFPDFPVLGNLCLNARTLREALESYQTFRPLIGEFDFLGYRETPEHAQFEYIAEFAPASGFQALSNFQVLASLIRAYDGLDQTAFRVSLMGPALPGANDIGEYFGAAVRYHADANRLQFTSALLDAPLVHYNATLAPFLRQQAQHELLRIQRGHRFSCSVEHLISEIIRDPGDEIDSSSLLAQTCKHLNTSRWTLHRRLQSEGLHFTELESRVRSKEACRLLGETALSLGQISEQLGFSSQSAFTRFFRTRHDVAPLAFRQRAKLG